MTAKAREDIATMLENASYTKGAQLIRAGVPVKAATAYIASGMGRNTFPPYKTTLANRRVMLAVELLHNR